jgi:hypothetical protein
MMRKTRRWRLGWEMVYLMLCYSMLCNFVFRCKRPVEICTFRQIRDGSTSGGLDWSSFAGNLHCNTCYKTFHKRGTLDRQQRPLPHSQGASLFLLLLLLLHHLVLPLNQHCFDPAFLNQPFLLVLSKSGDVLLLFGQVIVIGKRVIIKYVSMVAVVHADVSGLFLQTRVVTVAHRQNHQQCSHWQKSRT